MVFGDWYSFHVFVTSQVRVPGRVLAVSTRYCLKISVVPALSGRTTRVIAPLHSSPLEPSIELFATSSGSFQVLASPPKILETSWALNSRAVGVPFVHEPARFTGIDVAVPATGTDMIFACTSLELAYSYSPLPFGVTWGWNGGSNGNVHAF